LLNARLDAGGPRPGPRCKPRDPGCQHGLRPTLCACAGALCRLVVDGASLCLWWSGVPARGGRPPAMDGRRNGHGRTSRRRAQLSLLPRRPRTHVIAGDSWSCLPRVTPKRRGEPHKWYGATRDQFGALTRVRDGGLAALMNNDTLCPTQRPLPHRAKPGSEARPLNDGCQ
jgi:hypothetical protein